MAAVQARSVEERLAGAMGKAGRSGAGGGSSRHRLRPILLTMEASALPSKAGPVADRIAIWPVDDGRYGLDATFQGASGYDRAERHADGLRREGVRHSLRQELDGGWTLRFGPLRAAEVSVALGAFVR
jgi:hypothetical protein